MDDNLAEPSGSLVSWIRFPTRNATYENPARVEARRGPDIVRPAPDNSRV